MTIPEIVGLSIFCLLIACGIIIAILFLCGYLTYRSLVHRKESLDKLEQSPYVGALGPNLAEFNEYRDDAHKALKGTPFSWESVTADDEVRLFARLYKVVDAKTTVICLPGYMTSAVKSFADIVPFYMEKGYNVLLVTNRGHAESGGRHITFGIKESGDLLKWVDKVNELYPEGNVLIHGIELGANAAMLASGDLPHNVKGIIEDSGFSKPWDIFVYQIKQIYHLSPFPILHIAEYFTKRFAKVGYQDSAVKAVAESSVPILFIHGSRDMFVPPYMCHACYDSCTAPKAMLIVEGAGHTQACFKDKEAYIESLNSFIESL
ncbi:MAG: alpha/beta hydrolase [Clostridia bacterium]|nr:alpha/beta hydrolase [Clostridia bacterium]